MKRFLTQREAERCEMAKEPVCKCRCGGAKHGAGRLGKGGDFSILPMDDPHYRPSLTKNQALRLLNRALTYVICNGSNWGAFTGEAGVYDAWRETQTILTEAKKAVQNA